MKKAFSFLIVALLSTSLSFGDESSKEFFCGEESSTSLSNLNVLDAVSVDSTSIGDEAIDFAHMYSGKWLIVDVSATWCPFCKLDMWYFLNNVKPYYDNIEQLHITLTSNSGTPQSANETNFFLRVKSKSDPYTGSLDLREIDFAHSETRFSELQKLLDEERSLIFKHMTGYPYQMIFNPEGKLVFRGQFTRKLDSDGDDYMAPFQRQYAFITALLNGQCVPELSGD